jgi:hypothetical protein
MACIERRPRCGAATEPAIPEPLSTIGAAFAVIFGLFGVIGTIAGIFDKISVPGGILKIGGITIGGAGVAGALSALIAAVTIIVIVGVFALDRCVRGRGLSECVAGVVHQIIESFNSALDELFPFSAMHDRVDVVVRSRYWDVLESGEAFVHCTDELPPRRSEIMRCYYYERRVCQAAQAGIIGAGIGGAAGIIAGAAAAAAIGCATVILCLLAIIVAAIIAAVAALVGALIAGQAAKAAGEDSTPSADGVPIGVGDLVSVRGNMQRRDHDEGANVMWWVTSSDLHGRARDGLPQPFSYCEIDEELPTDSCPRAAEP